MKFSRHWAMPSLETFDIAAIAAFVGRHMATSKVSVDPFARNKRWATHTNDLDPKTAAEYHLDAEDFCMMLAARGVVADLLLFDPPYSLEQITRTYQSIGKSAAMEDTQNGLLYRRVRSAANRILSHDATVLSFGWNSAGMGKERGFEIVEIALVAHGGAHNDTICLAERRPPGLLPPPP